jgi:hypothetical protein
MGALAVLVRSSDGQIHNLGLDLPPSEEALSLPALARPPQQYRILRPEFGLAAQIRTMPTAFSVMKSAGNEPDHVAQILKSDDTDERFVLGVVLEPLKDMRDERGGVKKDTQKDTYSAAEVRKAAEFWAENFQNIGRQHQDIVTGKVRLLYNWVTHEDTVIGKRALKAGTWLLGVRVKDDGIWKAVKERRITGFSIGGWAHRAPLQA